MNEPSNMGHERLEVALARAIEDGVVVQFPSLPVLLAQLPEDLQPSVRQAFEVHKPFVTGWRFFVAHLRLDDVLDGSWGVATCSGSLTGYGFVLACDAARYDQWRRAFGRPDEDARRDAGVWN